MEVTAGLFGKVAAQDVQIFRWRLSQAERVRRAAAGPVVF
jgi:hypothetical protein